MIDPELKSHLEKIEAELSRSHKASTGLWRTLWRGCIYGAGYIIGAVLILLIAGWILNIVGIIPAFTGETNDFRTALGNVGGTVR